MNTTAVTPHMKEHNDTPAVIDPKKFVLWLLIVASVMLFAGFTSAYIVRRGEGNWLIFDLPNVFAYTTAIIALSSVTMQWAYISAKKDELGQLKTALFLTLCLGIAFAIGQLTGWQQLTANNIHLVGNPAESFIYIIPGTHLLHMIAGIGFVAVVLVKTLKFNVHKKNLLSINLCTTFWHFLGAMWVYLYFFFLINR
jgi:cytochrome c oxidase subunit 3